MFCIVVYPVTLLAWIHYRVHAVLCTTDLYICFTVHIMGQVISCNYCCNRNILSVLKLLQKHIISTKLIPVTLKYIMLISTRHKVAVKSVECCIS